MSPKGESKSNGEIERAVQEVQGIARTLREDLETLLNSKIHDKSCILPWLVEHAGTVYTLFHRGEPFDGMTAYRRLKGKDWTIPLPAFGEAVEFRSRARHKLESRWQEGLFLGMRLDTSEKIVGTSEGTFVVQSVRRVTADRRYSTTLIDSVLGLPWKPKPESESGVLSSELQEPFRMDPEMPEHPRAILKPAPPRPTMKNFYITRANLEKHGWTPGCPACLSTMAGQRQRGSESMFSIFFAFCTIEAFCSYFIFHLMFIFVFLNGVVCLLARILSKTIAWCVKND